MGSLALGLASDFQSLEVLAERAAQIAALEREFHRGLEEAQFVASVVALSFVDIGVHLFPLE